MTIRIALTPGEPAGIGPDLSILVAQASQDYELVAFADPDLLQSRANQLGLGITLKEIDLNRSAQTLAPGELGFVAVKLRQQAQAGQLNRNNSAYVLNCLDKAIDACQQGQCQAMVTGPVQKSVIIDAGFSFSGHTEYLAQKTDTPRVVMLLATEGLRVALVTTHLPLKQVADAITQEDLIAVTRILHRDLQNKFGIKDPTIVVCGLNPHAGEGGHLGREEIDTIIPALESLQKHNIRCIGPLPADTLFTAKYLDTADAVLAMYHDQGLPVLKYQGFGRAANITLGLPIIRTSVDHGTALDLAGTGNIDIGSLATAINSAQTMAKRSRL
ncbi:MAG: 4-hydroxythreonine-4-phosphate dehydrogenase PdxA [Pseudomonadota bacterium]